MLGLEVYHIVQHGVQYLELHIILPPYTIYLVSNVIKYRELILTGMFGDHGAAGLFLQSSGWTLNEYSFYLATY